MNAGTFTSTKCNNWLVKTTPRETLEPGPFIRNTGLLSFPFNVCSSDLHQMSTKVFM